MRRAINPEGVFDSTRYGFSQAVVSAGTRRVHLSGQVGVDADLHIVGVTLDEQAARALDNIATVLGAAGGALGDVVMLRIYIVDAAADDLTPISRILRGTFPDGPPASTWVSVSGLADPSWLVEIEAEAVLP